MTPPIIFLAFANHPDSHLALLQKESSEIFSHLIELDKKQMIRIHRDESIELREVYELFNNYPDQVAIFHYGGHAGGKQLLLEGGGGYAEGLAQLMGEQKGLRLVFLNGCSTLGQVKLLLDQGVKAVIATSVKIQDDRAVEFAVQFYQALANRRSLEQAFGIAQSFISSKYGDKTGFSFRDLVFDDWETALAAEQVQDATEIPWGLYTQEVDRTQILNWKLPYYRSVGLPKEMLQYIGNSFKANRYIMLVLDEMCKYNPDIYAKMVEKRGEETVKKDSSQYPSIIIGDFPWPIGNQIRLLRIYSDPDLERLQHLISTYVMISQVMYYILLSDLWEQNRNGDLSASWSPLQQDKASFSQFDFFAQLPALYHSIQEKGIPFISELDVLITAMEEEGSMLNKSHLLLEQIRGLIHTGQSVDDLSKICLKAEQAVSVILRHIAFLARYRMLTVRNVMIEKPRFEPLAYELDMGRLNGVQGVDIGLYQDPAYRRKESYTDSSSIVLVANEDQLDQALNLSPFLMDYNTFVMLNKGKTSNKEELASIFMMAWTEKERLYYLSVEHSFFHALSNVGDQVHTDMTQQIFNQGQNLADTETSNTIELDDFNFDFGFEEENQDSDSSAEEETKVFQVLKDQYDMLIRDFQ